MVACDLAKVIVGVRFSYPAPYNPVFGEMDIISVFETEGGSSILSRPATVPIVQWIERIPPKN